MNALKTAGLLLILLTAGCGRIASPGDLLHAPNLAGEEQSLYRAVQPFLPAGYQLTTPDQSDQGSAIRLADLDGDGEKELIVSYKRPETDYEVNVLILSQTNGAWQKSALITRSGINLDYLAIKPLLNRSSAQLLLGYDGGGTGLPKELYVYSLTGAKAEPILHRSYEQISTGELLGNGLSQIAIVPPSENVENTRSRIEILGEKNGEVTEIAERRTEGTILSMKIDQASSTRIGLFAQVLGTTRSGYSMLLAWEDGRLANILSLPKASYDSRALRQDLRLGPPDFNPNLAATGQKWWIDYPANNRDVDDDGILEIAMPNPMPGSDDASGTPQLWSDSYYRWDGESRMRFVEDRFWQWGYDLRIPDRWQGKYRIELPDGNPESISEVRFMYTPEADSDAEANAGDDSAGSASADNADPAPEAVLLTLRQLSSEEWNRLQPMLDSRQTQYVVLGDKNSMVAGHSSQITIALLPNAATRLSGEDAASYEALRLTASEVKRLAGLDEDSREEEEAFSHVEEH
ncbi:MULTISPECIES: hypothetical protein [Saccharibacillus]|uniref:hypothetical protein n=1 Tax=Saccharibacillus TaxID=456492 RepID=UPI00123851C5|nr:hypothetical protein [Saccharibacillus sp. WB 17]MWJ32770.1 hypothetical protein [Saccharibacillus sp. WB 17]